MRRTALELRARALAVEVAREAQYEDAPAPDPVGAALLLRLDLRDPKPRLSVPDLAPPRDNGRGGNVLRAA